MLPVPWPINGASATKASDFFQYSRRNPGDVLMLLAAARGGINGLMAEVLEDHIRLHLLKDGHAPLTPELGEDLIDLVRAYLK